MKDISAPLLESNALFLKAHDWAALKGYDPAFDQPGGGAANPDVLRRALDLAQAQLIRIAKEATFHQLHGGTTTHGRDHAIAAVKDAARQYSKLRGQPLRHVRELGWIYDANTKTLHKSA